MSFDQTVRDVLLFKIYRQFLCYYWVLVRLMMSHIASHPLPLFKVYMLKYNMDGSMRSGDGWESWDEVSLCHYNCILSLLSLTAWVFKSPLATSRIANSLSWTYPRDALVGLRFCQCSSFNQPFFYYVSNRVHLWVGIITGVSEACFIVSFYIIPIMSSTGSVWGWLIYESQT